MIGFPLFDFGFRKCCNFTVQNVIKRVLKHKNIIFGILSFITYVCLHFKD